MSVTVEFSCAVEPADSLEVRHDGKELCFTMDVQDSATAEAIYLTLPQAMVLSDFLTRWIAQRAGGMS